MTGAILSLTPLGTGQAPDAAATQTIVLTLLRKVDVWVGGLLPLLLGLGLALITLAATILTLCLGNHWNSDVKASSSWTFRDSWATNIAAIGAVLGTILTATGSASTLFPDVQIDRYAVLSAAWGGLVVLAPIIIGLYGNSDSTSSGVQVPTPLMFIAAFITLTAVVSELATIGILASLSSVSGGVRMFVYVILAVVTALTSFYAGCTIHALVGSQKTDGVANLQPHSALARFEDTSLTL
jgi:hypothetical protein